jgi:hypothetical protein
MYYKIKALASAGAKITLHFFDYRPLRGTTGLQEDCVAIYRYRRKSLVAALPVTNPFIVGSRINSALVERLNKDHHPVLLEGLHCAGIIPFLNDPNRVVLRMHNNEAKYYSYLANTENSFLKKAYLSWESRRLQAYQNILSKQLRLACLSQTDLGVFEKLYRFKQAHFIPCFIPWQQLSIKAGKGNYCLYHGNLGVSENEEAALWLIIQVFSKIPVPLKIAGKGISNRVARAASAYKNVELINDPTIEKISELVKNAHINVLPSLNATGVKLKLLNALLNGRYCITNKAGVEGSSIHSGVVVEDDSAAWISNINYLMQQDLTAMEVNIRQPVLELYNNRQNADRLIALW